MQRKKLITILIVGALAVTVAFGAIAYQTVFAASATSISTNTTISSKTTILKGPGGPYGGYNNEDLAAALGITIDALNKAYQDAYSAALKQAVTDGLITQAQADELASKGSVFPFGNRWDGWLTQNGIDFNTYLADALGISVDTLRAAYQTAYNTNIDQQVTDGTLTQDQADLMKGRYALSNDSTFQSSMQSAYTSAVNAAVASGVITQSQADQILSKNGYPMMFGMDGMGGPRGPRGHGGNFAPDGNIPPTTAP